jgi:hypothetical protein
MLETMVERTAERFIEITNDEGVKSLRVGRDWAGFLQFLTDLFENFGPLIEKCFLTSRGQPELTSAEVIQRAAIWSPVMGHDRRQRRREIGPFENILLSRWMRQMDQRIDDEVGTEFDNDEISEAVVYTIANSTPEELTALRSDYDRLREEA